MTNLVIASKSIRQLDGLYNLNDLHKAAGGEEKHKPYKFLRNEQTRQLIAEIEKGTDLSLLAVKTTNGRNGGTFVCKELVYAYAMWISPKFNLQVIRAFDALNNRAEQPQTPQLPDKTHRYYLREETQSGELISQTLITPECLSQFIDEHLQAYMLIERKWLREHLEWVHEQAAIAASAIQLRNQYMLNKTYHPDPAKAQEMRKQKVIKQLEERMS